jgi:hypothetical protein
MNPPSSAASSAPYSDLTIAPRPPPPSTGPLAHALRQTPAFASAPSDVQERVRDPRMGYARRLQSALLRGVPFDTALRDALRAAGNSEGVPQGIAAFTTDGSDSATMTTTKNTTRKRPASAITPSPLLPLAPPSTAGQDASLARATHPDPGAPPPPKRARRPPTGFELYRAERKQYFRTQVWPQESANAPVTFQNVTAYNRALNAWARGEWERLTDAQRQQYEARRNAASVAAATAGNRTPAQQGMEELMRDVLGV